MNLLKISQVPARDTSVSVKFELSYTVQLNNTTISIKIILTNMIGLVSWPPFTVSNVSTMR